MKNMRIGTKVVSVVLLLAVIAITAVGYAVHKMSDIGTTYSHLVFESETTFRKIGEAKR